jgi:RNA polymerase sigma factor (sigma-70 family)
LHRQTENRVLIKKNKVMRNFNFKENNFVVRDGSAEMLRIEMAKRKPLADDVVRSLIADGSTKSRNAVVEANMCLVWSISANYQNMGLDFMDVYQNGVIGLIKATETYDVSRETLFSTWAAEYIRKYIGIGLDNDSRVVRQPSMTIRAKESYSATSVDAPIGNEEGEEKTLLDFMPSDMSADNFSKIEDARVKINYLLGGLDEREKAIVCGLFGFGCTEMSAYTLSKKFGITEERVRQIKWDALEKMKNM